MAEFFETLLSATWLTSFVNILIQAIMVIVGVILLPISALINTLFPNFDDALSKIDIIFDYALQYSGWFISAFAIPSAIIAILLGYYTFTVTLRMSVWGLKLGLAWFKAFK